ncbi:hypothetical protein AUC70_06030 [Methyloceanibacter stevinii]|uniref:Uncharacterized protein n=1 Tax=Methyloceanibacter stevinii TaxID=1774970 RepID=A0A1E3VNZ5_9HYPH|nr:hypothetical protein AUC70_06030 [Methyloceanibacter stevinii]
MGTEVLGQLLADREVHIRKGRRIGSHDSRDNIVGGAAGEPDAQGADLAAFRCRCVFAGLLEQRKDGLGVGMELRATGGQRDATGTALEQSDTEFRFESGNLPAERRLGKIEPLRRAAKMQGLGEDAKRAQVLGVNHLGALSGDHPHSC